MSRLSEATQRRLLQAGLDRATDLPEPPERGLSPAQWAGLILVWATILFAIPLAFALMGCSATPPTSRQQTIDGMRPSIFGSEILP